MAAIVAASVATFCKTSDRDKIANATEI